MLLSVCPRNAYTVISMQRGPTFSPKVIDSHLFTLQQLWINSKTITISDVFMRTVSAHGGLEHVFFSIHSVTVDGVSSLIANSPRLLTSKVSGYLIQGKDAVSDWEKIMLEKHSGRKLFTAGGLK